MDQNEGGGESPLHPVLPAPDDRSVSGQFLLFSGIGFIGTVVHYLVLMGMVEIFVIGPVIASVFAFATGALVNYSLNYRITFRSDKPHREAMSKFFVIAAGGLLLNTVIMAIATKVFSLYYLIAQVLATCMVLLWNFGGNLLWTFRRREDYGE